MVAAARVVVVEAGAQQRRNHWERPEESAFCFGLGWLEYLGVLSFGFAIWLGNFNSRVRVECSLAAYARFVCWDVRAWVRMSDLRFPSRDGLARKCCGRPQDSL